MANSTTLGPVATYQTHKDCSGEVFDGKAWRNFIFRFLNILYGSEGTEKYFFPYLFSPIRISLLSLCCIILLPLLSPPHPLLTTECLLIWFGPAITIVYSEFSSIVTQVQFLVGRFLSLLGTSAKKDFIEICLLTQFHSLQYFPFFFGTCINNLILPIFF